MFYLNFLLTIKFISSRVNMFASPAPFLTKCAPHTASVILISAASSATKELEPSRMIKALSLIIPSGNEIFFAIVTLLLLKHDLIVVICNILSQLFGFLLQRLNMTVQRFKSFYYKFFNFFFNCFVLNGR